VKEEEKGQLIQDKDGTNVGGTYFDVRIKAHQSSQGRCVIFIFTNVSAEKEL
jgi:hypothetical protein